MGVRPGRSRKSQTDSSSSDIISSAVYGEKVILPGELCHSLQEPGGVAVQRHGVALEASRCSQLSPPLLPWTRTTCGTTELTSVGRRLQRPPSGNGGEDGCAIPTARALSQEFILAFKGTSPVEITWPLSRRSIIQKGYRYR